MTTPKPTPTLMEFLDRARYRMSMTDDEYDRLRAALEHLEGLRKQAEVFQDCNTGLARERDALRAEVAAITESARVDRVAAGAIRESLEQENAALKERLEAAEKDAERSGGYATAVNNQFLQACMIINPAEDTPFLEACAQVVAARDDAESRATTLAARVEALEALFKAAFKFPSVLLQEETRNFIVALGEKYDALPPVPSTPAADLAAHDDRIRRETVERTVEEVMDVDCVRDLDGFERLNIQEAIHRAAGIEETK